MCFPEEEEKVMVYWQEKDCFKQQLEKTKEMPPFTFYDGPPFATGTPHYGHICAGTIKDVVCRYASQTGHYVSRRFGWDCHGLPVEYEIDKTLGIKDKRQVLDMGIAKYNQECRSIVMRYSSLWEKVVTRFGRWIDFKNDYKTLDTSFMESVWFVFKTLFEKDLVYRGRKIMPYSNAVHTVLSNFEVQLNYKEVDDPSLWVTFPIAKEPDVKFLVWTTTPWTLPSNLALAVNPNFIYVKLKDLKRNEIYIMAEVRLPHFYKSKKKKAEGDKEYEILEKFKGSDLKGIEYVPMFDYFLERSKDGCFKVQTADFVTDDAGSGIVHCAPGFGEDDYKMCVREKIITPDNPPVPLDESGRFTKEVSDYEGVYVKDADKLIIKSLKERGRVVLHETEKHNYPYCWRSDTPLIYKAVSTWFIKVTSLKDDLIENNKKANWVPKVIQEKRFNNWLSDSQDWCFSRNRYWGNPIPLWVSDDGEEIVCVGSVKELEELTGAKVNDLHREFIDHLTIPSKQGKGQLKRIEEVFDCWFESGSMPFAQVHYPFSTSEEEFQKIFPADFIAEGIDQTRGWFYTLNVISTGVKNLNPYKNLIVNGLVLNHEGKKMSKRLQNYPDPMYVVHEFGADAIRLYLINSPLVRADSLNFSTDGVKEVVKNIFLPWYNAYRFLVQNIMKWELKEGKPFTFVEDIESLQSKFNITDEWIEDALQTLIADVRKEMEEYKLYNVVPPLVKFLENLTNWYVRLNRNRLKGEVGDEAMLVGLNVLFDVLFKVNILMSPSVPFLTENMYQNMKKCLKAESPQNQDSIHHLFIPTVSKKLQNKKVEQVMQKTMAIIEVARKLRETKGISLKQPIMSLTIVNSSEELEADLKPFLAFIEEEINVSSIGHEKDVGKYVKLTGLPNLPVLGPKFKGNKDFGNLKDRIKQLESDTLKVVQEKGEIEIEGNKLTLEDLLITQKFIDDNIEPHQVIGGDKVIVLLDVRQNEELRIQGSAREIINKIQRLKRKGHLKAEDEVFIFYRFGEQAEYLNKAMEVESKTIKSAVKKPLFPLDEKGLLVTIVTDKGNINGEEYELIITYPHLMVLPGLNESFGEKGPILAQALQSKPYKEVKGMKEINIRLDGQDFLLAHGKHYEQF